MAHYDGVSAVSRKLTKQYDGVSGVARKTKKVYDGVDGVARLSYAGLYTWAKYTSEAVSYTTTYGAVKWEYDELTHRIWNLSFAIEHEYCEYLREGDNGIECRFKTYSNYDEDHYNATGELVLTGMQFYYKDESELITEYDAEENLVGRFVYLDGEIRFIRAADLLGGYVYYLDLSERLLPGDIQYTYTYAFRYVEDVQSDDPNAYTEGSTAGYTSSSSNDIRTVYVRVERD